MSYFSDLKDVSLEPARSPYSNGFENFLDPKIRDLVLDFSTRGYLRCSSCEGHSFLQPRYIILCFGSQESRDYIKTHFKYFPQISSDTNSKERFGQRTIIHQDPSEEIKGYNNLFVRNYERSWFLRIYIGAYFNESDENWIEIISKQMAVITFNFLFRKIMTVYFHYLIRKLPKANF